jgi:hypothetical protein
MTTTTRQDGACQIHRDKLTVTFVAGKKTMAWTIYDAACKPCTFTVEQPVAKHH